MYGALWEQSLKLTLKNKKHSVMFVRGYEYSRQRKEIQNESHMTDPGPLGSHRCFSEGQGTGRDRVKVRGDGSQGLVLFLQARRVLKGLALKGSL